MPDHAWLPLAAALLASTLVGLDRPEVRAQDHEAIPIADLREYPERYHLHQVTVRGTAHDVRAFDPYKLPAGSVCYGAYSFRLVDETGTLPVIVMGVCGVPIVKDPDVEDGDVLTAQVTAQAPGKGTFFLTLDGRRMSFSDTDEMQGVALNIWVDPKSPASASQEDIDPRFPFQSR